MISYNNTTNKDNYLVGVSDIFNIETKFIIRKDIDIENIKVHRHTYNKMIILSLSGDSPFHGNYKTSTKFGIRTTIEHRFKEAKDLYRYFIRLGTTKNWADLGIKGY